MLLLAKISLFSLFPDFSPSPTIFPRMSSSPMMYSSDLDSRGSSDLFSSRSSVLHDSGLFPLSDSGLTISGDRNDSTRRFFPPDNGLILHGQDTAAMFSSASMVCHLIFLGCLLYRQKASGSPVFWRVSPHLSVRPWSRISGKCPTRGKCEIAS